MESPKSNFYKERKSTSQPRRKHKNKKFYNSASWRETRKAYLSEYQMKIFNECGRGYWTVNGQTLELSPNQQTYILSLDYPPCEMCLKFYIAGAYDFIRMGEELDHINPINRDNALEADGHGEPLSHDNLQLLCKKHHAKKSQRER